MSIEDFQALCTLYVNCQYLSEESKQFIISALFKYVQ